MSINIALTALVLMFIFSISAVANAAVLSSEYIQEARAYTTVNSQGTVNVSFRIYGTNKMDVLGAKTIIVQEQAPGSSQWTAVATYSAACERIILASGIPIRSTARLALVASTRAMGSAFPEE
mgnify:CR=1 FL=1